MMIRFVISRVLLAGLLLGGIVLFPPSKGASQQDGAPPPPPTHLRAVSLSNGVVKLWWDFSACTVDERERYPCPNVREYRIYMGVADRGINFNRPIAVVPARQQWWQSKARETMVISRRLGWGLQHPKQWFNGEVELLPGVKYVFAVKAVDSRGRESEPSNEAHRLPVIRHYPADHKTEIDGLLDGRVLFRAQDRRGRLWFMTASGISLWDPQRRIWKTFTTEDGLTANKANAYAFDAQGDLWIGTSKGVDVFLMDPARWEHYSHENYTTQPGDTFKNIASQSQYRIDVNELLSYNERFLPEEQYKALFQGEEGEDTSKPLNPNSEVLIPSQPIAWGVAEATEGRPTILADGEGDLWFITLREGGGVSRFIKGSQSWESFMPDKGSFPQDLKPKFLITDHEGRICVAAEKGKGEDAIICYYDDGWQTPSAEIEGDAVQSSAISFSPAREFLGADRYGNFWFEDPKEQSISVYDPLHDTWHDPPTEGAPKGINSFRDGDGKSRTFIEDHEGNLWFVSDGALYRFSYLGDVTQGRWSSFAWNIESEGLIKNICLDGRGSIWVWGEQAEKIYNLTAETQYALNEIGFSKPPDYCFDDGKYIWFLLARKYISVVRYSHKTQEFERYAPKGLLENSNVKLVFKDHQGVFWLAVDGLISPEGNRTLPPGIYRYVPTEEKHLFFPIRDIGFDAEHPFFSWGLPSMIDDGRGDLFLISSFYEGLFVYESQNHGWKVYRGEEYPFLNDPEFIGKDLQGNVWIISEIPQGGPGSGETRYALARFSPKEGRFLDVIYSGHSIASDAMPEQAVSDPQGNVWLFFDPKYGEGALVFEGPPLHFPWGAFSLALIVLISGSTGTYIYHHQRPSTRVRRLHRRIREAPERLLAEIYGALSPTDPQVLELLAHKLSKDGELQTAELVRAFAELARSIQSPHLKLSEALRRVKERLQTCREALQGCEELCTLYRLWAAAYGASSVTDLTALDVTVQQGRKGSTINTRFGYIEELPDFLSPRLIWVLEALQGVLELLYKYQRVEGAVDQLAYLGDAGDLLQRAWEPSEELSEPERSLIKAILEHWRSLLTKERRRVSGRAQLRAELRTRRALRSRRVALVVQLANVGRSIAENVRVTLQPSSQYVIEMDEVELVSLPAGQKDNVEFFIRPLGSGGELRVCFTVTWDDREAQGKKTELSGTLQLFETEEFTPIENPYVAGAPVRDPKVFHGREDVFHFIEENLIRTFRNRTILIYGQRRTGKTSVLYQLLRHRLPQDFLGVYVDMQELAPSVRNLGDLLAAIGERLVAVAAKQGLKLEHHPEGYTHRPTEAFGHLLDQLQVSAREKRTLFVIDEFEGIEQLVAQKRLEPEVFGYLRSLMQHRDQLGFIFCGSHSLQELNPQYWSIFFNIAIYRKISYLKEEDARRLIVEPVRGSVSYDGLAVEKILKLTQGHPYFIQLICWSLIERLKEERRNYVTLQDVNAVLEEILIGGEAHFRFVWFELITEHEERVMMAALAELIRPGIDHILPSEVVKLLNNNGLDFSREEVASYLERLCQKELLTKEADGQKYGFRVELVRLWVAENYPLERLLTEGGS